MGHTAGVAGLEPANAGVKVPCLTTWRHPIAGCPPHDAADLKGKGRIVGLEPTTSRATIWRSTTELYPPQSSGFPRPPSRIVSALSASTQLGISAPGGIRTPDPRLRRPLLYPTELQAQTGNQAIHPSGLLADRYRLYQTLPALSTPFFEKNSGCGQLLPHPDLPVTTLAAARGQLPLPSGISSHQSAAGSCCRSTSAPESAG